MLRHVVLALKIVELMLLKRHKKRFDGPRFKLLMMLKVKTNQKHLKALCVVKALLLINFQRSKQVKLKKFVLKDVKGQKP